MNVCRCFWLNTAHRQSNSCFERVPIPNKSKKRRSTMHLIRGAVLISIFKWILKWNNSEFQHFVFQLLIWSSFARPFIAAENVIRILICLLAKRISTACLKHCTRKREYEWKKKHTTFFFFCALLWLLKIQQKMKGHMDAIHIFFLFYFLVSFLTPTGNLCHQRCFRISGMLSFETLNTDFWHLYKASNRI